jgi:hypothetical protein
MFTLSRCFNVQPCFCKYFCYVPVGFSLREFLHSVSDEQQIYAGLNSITDYEGLWVDNGVPGVKVIRLRKDKKLGYVLENISVLAPNSKSESYPEQVKKSKKNGKIILTDVEKNGRYYVEEENGDLKVYDKDVHKGYPDVNMGSYQKLK